MVISGRKFHFFSVPRLGSAFAFKLVVPVYTNTDSFVDCLAKTRQHLAECRELEEQRTVDEREYQERLEKAQKEGEDTGSIVRDYEEKTYAVPQKQVPMCEYKNYLLVFDNLGDDVPISREKLAEILQLCLMVKRTWEEKGLAKLQDDVEAYMPMAEKSDVGRLAEFEKEFQAHLAAQPATADAPPRDEATATGPQEASLATQNMLVEGVAHLAQKYAEVWPELQELKRLNWGRFAEILQMSLFAMEMTKGDTNVPGTNLVSWRHCMGLLKTLEPENIAKFKWNEPKTGAFLPYQLTNVLHDRLQGLPWADVGAYSFPLFVLGQYTLYLMKLRLENVRVRRLEATFRSDFRQKRMEMAKERADKRREELEAEKQRFLAAQAENSEGTEVAEDGSPREKEMFKQAEWLAEWDARNPEVEIPEESTPDVDNDIAAEYTFAA